MQTVLIKIPYTLIILIMKKETITSKTEMPTTINLYFYDSIVIIICTKI